jgi:hypothetical protein
MVALLIVIAVFVAAGILALRHAFRKGANAGEEAPAQGSGPARTEGGGTASACQPDPAQCGVSCFCDEATLERAVRTEVEYFDDEELDRYKGMGSDDYSDEQTDEFNEVLTTLKPSEVGDWLRSLQLRGIALPSALKDEALMLMNDAH